MASNIITIVLKIAERCNLDCAYCYMYHGADQSWRRRPVFLSETNQADMIRRLVQHADEFADASLILGIHGGEPLLLGKKRMREFLADTRQVLSPEKLHIVLQTNAVLLDSEWLTIFSDFSVQVSISCDGPTDVHDTFRIFHNGEPTGKIVEEAIRLCIDWPDQNLFAGVLTVANPQFNGAEIVRYFYDLGVRRLDLLYPDANYVSPPAHLPDYSHERLLRYMTDAFDEWIKIGSLDFRIRKFREMISGVLGRASNLDSCGGDLSSVIVVESDGSYQLLDVLHICSEEATLTPLHIHSDSLQDYITWTSAVLPGSCAECQICPAFTACGGGYLPHRFNGTNYDNPSFYCDVLLGLYRHIKEYVIRVTPSTLWKQRVPMQHKSEGVLTTVG